MLLFILETGCGYSLLQSALLRLPLPLHELPNVVRSHCWLDDDSLVDGALEHCELGIAFEEDARVRQSLVANVENFVADDEAV